MRNLRAFQRALTVFVVVAGLLSLAVPANAAVPVVSAVSHVSQAVPASPTRIDLRGDGAPSAARMARVKKWKGTRLSFYETLPAKWDWSLSTAVAKWNGTGGRIKLVRTTNRNRAKLVIGYGATQGGAAGAATMGSTRRAWVHLNPRYNNLDALKPVNRVGAMAVLTHELGHVLGFGHSTARCSVMRSVQDISGCHLAPATLPGHYKCRTIEPPLVVAFVRLYGGRAIYPGTWCPIDPLPPTLSGVAFTGGDGPSSPVTIRWRTPAATPSGSRVVVTRWAASSCGTAPGSAAVTTYRPVGSGLYQDDAAQRAEQACFRVQLVNRYGAGRGTVSQLMQRSVAPPAAPVIGTPTWDPVAGRFHASVSYGGTRLVFKESASPEGPCPGAGAWTTAFPVVEDADRLTPGVGEFSTFEPRTCVSFYAIDDVTGLASAPTPVVVAAPPVQETVEVGALSLGRRMYAFWEATATVTQPGNSVATAVLAGACPSTAPSTAIWYVLHPGGNSSSTLPPEFADVYALASTGRGTNCALFTALDWYGSRRLGSSSGVGSHHGPVVMREFTDAGPLAPAIGEPTFDASTGKVSGSASADTALLAIYDPAHPTVCPGVGQQGSAAIGLDTGNQYRYSFVPPAAETCVTFYSEGVWGVSQTTQKTFVVPAGA